MTTGKTSTFIIHHDKCDPGTWTARDIMMFESFIQSGDHRFAETLTRLGVQLIASEHHVPKGGTLQEIGWLTDSYGLEVQADLDDVLGDAGDLQIVPAFRVYRGPLEFALRIPIGDGDGNVDGHETEIKSTREEAEALIKSMHDTGWVTEQAMDAEEQRS